MGSLRQKLDKFEKRNRPPKIWRVSTLPTFNRNDGKFLRYDTNEDGEPIRVYQDSDPKLVPEVAFSHDAQKIFQDMTSAHSLMTGGWILLNPAGMMILCSWISMITAKSSGSVSRCLSQIGYPSPGHAAYSPVSFGLTTPRTNSLSSIRWWHWDPVKKFTFTIEERTVVVPVRHDLAVMRTEEYPTLINVQTEEWFEKDIKRKAKATGRSEDEMRAENTILVQSSTVITKKDRKYYSAKHEEEKQKCVVSGYLLLKDVKEGVAMPLNISGRSARRERRRPWVNYCRRCETQ